MFVVPNIVEGVSFFKELRKYLMFIFLLKI